MSDNNTGSSTAPAAAVESGGLPPESAEVTSTEAEGSTEETQEVSASEGSEESSDASTEEAQDAAKKIKAKEVKGSDGEKFKIKVDGKEVELSKEEVVRFAQMGKAGQRAMQEKAELQKRTATFLETLKSNPRAILTDPAIGIDIRKLAQEILAEQLEEEALTPEQKKLKDVESELEKLRKEKTDEAQNRKKQDFEREVQKYEEELQVKVQEALEAEKLPRKPAILSKMAEILITAHDNKLNITPRQAAKLAKEELINDIRELSGVLGDDDLESFFGADIMTRIRKASLKKVKPVIPTIRTQETANGMGAKSESKPREKVDMKNFLNNIYFQGEKKK